MNAKINKVCTVVVQICSIATAIAQVVAAAFPVPVADKVLSSQEKQISDFMRGDD